MTFLSAYMAGGLLILCAMTALWLLSLLIKDASIVDIVWGLGFVILAWFYLFVTENTSPRNWLIVSLVTIWGLRLTIHLALRNIGKGEDFRYQRWREEEGNRWWWLSYIRVFLLQGFIMWIVSLPLLGAQILSNNSQLQFPDYVAIVLWLIGFVFEAVGDWQLVQFKSKPSNKGQVLDTGLWRYTRHPNYFGDALQWWAFYIVSLAAGVWWTIISPITMTFFLMRISGVPMLESNMKRNKPQYSEYIEKTSAFFPMPPRD